MRYILFTLAFFVTSLSGALAQDQPQITVDVTETEILVGQPLTVRIKVLVPTWMPKPPEFPSLEVPGLLVRLPERASQPVSERLNGETWAGVQRSYRLYPLQPGGFEIPELPLRVSYAQPGSTDALVFDAMLPPIQFDAVVPKGARDLSPLIIAQDFTLDAELDTPDALAVGAAVVRTLTARIDGTTPVLIPALTPTTGSEQFRIYPDEPKVAETEARGVLSGSRTERTTYLAQAEGDATLPAVEIAWFNLRTNAVETARVPAVSLLIVAGEAGPTDLSDLPWRIVLTLLALAVGLGLVLRAAWPRIKTAITTARTAWVHSELHAHRTVLEAIRARDLGAAFAAYDTWKPFYPMMSDAALDKVFAAVGDTQFAERSSKSPGQAWSDLKADYVGLRKQMRRAQRLKKRETNLSPLNPDWGR